MKRILIPITLLVLAIGGALAWKLHAQEEALSGPPGGSGVVEATTVDLTSRVTARVEAVHVRPGEAVTEGQLLVELDCSDAEALLAEAEARGRAAAAQADAARAQTDAARRNASAARAAARSARDRIDALESRQELASRQADRVAALGEHVSVARLDEARTAADGLGLEVGSARTSAEASIRQAAAASAQTDAAGAQAEAAARSVEAAEAAIARARLLVGECQVRAPRAAVVDEVYYEVGELPRPGATLVRLVDLAEVTATFYLPNAELGAVRLGQRARVEADAFPGQPVEGTVVTVSTEAEFTPRNIQTRTDRDRLVYPIEVRVPNEGGPVLLRPGMPVQVTLLGGGR